jgi:hypothetical protein
MGAGEAGGRTVNEEIIFLATAPNETIALFWKEMLDDAGIPALLRPGGPGAGGWGSVAMFAHDVYVRQDDLTRAQEIIADDPDEELIFEE